MPTNDVTWTTFSYNADFDSDSRQTVYQPEILAVISNGKSSAPISMIVDSGAQSTLIHADWAPELGINLGNCERKAIGGITGAGKGYVHPVSIRLDALKDEFVVDAIFLPNLGISGILGQLDFFNRYLVTFDRSHLSFSLAKASRLQF